MIYAGELIYLALELIIVSKMWISRREHGMFADDGQVAGTMNCYFTETPSLELERCGFTMALPAVTKRLRR